jgi:hypothetical protein
MAQCSDRVVEIRLGFAHCLEEPGDQWSIQLHSGVSITAPTPIQQQVLSLQSGLISTNCAKYPKLLISHPDLRHALSISCCDLNLDSKFERNVACGAICSVFGVKWSIKVESRAMNV